MSVDTRQHVVLLSKHILFQPNRRASYLQVEVWARGRVRPCLVRSLTGELGVHLVNPYAGNRSFRMSLPPFQSQLPLLIRSQRFLSQLRALGELFPLAARGVRGGRRQLRRRRLPNLSLLLPRNPGRRGNVSSSSCTLLRCDVLTAFSDSGPCFPAVSSHSASRASPRAATGQPRTVRPPFPSRLYQGVTSFGEFYGLCTICYDLVCYLLHDPMLLSSLFAFHTMFTRSISCYPCIMLCIIDIVCFHDNDELERYCVHWSVQR